MADQLQSGQIKLRVHGAPDTNSRVRAAVFARQLAALVKALETADRIANGGMRFDYVIAELKNESASATLTEVVMSKRPRQKSGADVLGATIAGIGDLDRAVLEQYGACLPHIAAIARGVAEEFSHTDLSIGGFKPFRVDDFFLKQVVRAQTIATPKPQRLYRGVAIGTFDGTIKEVDLRGDTPRLKLILRAGGREIDCVYVGATSEQIREILDRRVSVEGRAHYNGTSGLPERIEILHYKEVKPRPDMLRWQGRFNNLIAADWDGAA
ncbi:MULTISPECIES: hypothetical protein [Azospirillaceae]|jgi:hypothetical protein|uniref:hypothetical protein n=1 Tax=Azospirillaceae TaxID=2829815 RepID=UPI000B6A56EF|nr:MULTISPECIES: hypothetical protein [Azospirillaceae]MDG5496967.1 hypothetical protein [Niveispirillum sp. BGYR6]SNS83693.1 hypothetical protein SAMN05880556_11321 [Azospirillum sp. RU38E]SNT00878.1 hypothetical protein SAMN05880591_11320 [Azospirillum sp. RU37A]